MIVTVVEVDGIFAQRLFPKRCRSGFELPSVDEDLSFATNKENAAAIAVKHLDPVAGLYAIALALAS